MIIHINKAHFPVTVLGPGKRIGIWLQGCSIGCKNCISQDTWDSKANRSMSVAQLLDWCKQVSTVKGRQLDGITISGGEPFDQPKALAALLDGLISWRKQLQTDFDILCYSGYPFTTLNKKHADILGKLDVLIPEPYIDVQPTTQPWRGSDNQSLQLLSELARRKYPAHLNTVNSGKQIQLVVDGQQVWVIGIPARGDMQKIETQCLEQGIAFQQPSWRP